MSCSLCDSGLISTGQLKSIHNAKIHNFMWITYEMIYIIQFHLSMVNFTFYWFLKTISTHLPVSSMNSTHKTFLASFCPEDDENRWHSYLQDFFNALKVPRNLVKKIFNCILISHLQHSYHVMKMCNSFCHPWKYFLSKSLSRKILNGYGGTCIASRRHIICMLCFFDKISSSIRFTILAINIFI